MMQKKVSKYDLEKWNMKREIDEVVLDWEEM